MYQVSVKYSFPSLRVRNDNEMWDSVSSSTASDCGYVHILKMVNCTENIFLSWQSFQTSEKKNGQYIILHTANIWIIKK